MSHANYRPPSDSIKYDPEEHPDLAYKLGLLGLSQVEMAGVIGVCERTFQEWVKLHPELHAALIDAGEKADAEVAVSLRQRAMGYHRPVTKVVFNEETGETIITEYTEFIPPDTRAAQYWLGNRDRARARARQKLGDYEAQPRWTNKETLEVTGPNNGPVNVDVTDARERVRGRIAGIASRIGKSGDTGGAE